MPRKKSENVISSNHLPKTVGLLADNAAQLAEFVAIALIAVEELRIKTKPIRNFILTSMEREILLSVPTISRPANKKLSEENPDFTVVDVARMAMAIAEHSTHATLPQQVPLLRVGKQLIDLLQQCIDDESKIAANKAKRSKTKSDPTVIYQFKIHSVAPSRQSGDEFMLKIALSTNSMNTSRHQWAGPTVISIDSRSATINMVIRC